MDSNLEWIKPFSTILIPIVTSVAAILAWVAKIRWSNEYREVVDKQINAAGKAAEDRITIAKERADLAEKNAKDSIAQAEKHVEYLEKELKIYAELAPQKIREHFEAMGHLDRQRIINLQQLLDRAKEEIREKEKEIADLKHQARHSMERLDELQSSLAQTRKQEAFIEQQLHILSNRDEDLNTVMQVLNRPDFDMETVRVILERIESEKRWISSTARKALAQKQSERARQTRKAVEAARAKNVQRESAQQSMKASMEDSE